MAVISVVLVNVSNILNRQPSFFTNETFIYIFYIKFWLAENYLLIFFSISFTVGMC